ncbi:MAG: Hsp20/alpha crystallin family protein [Cytophagales bacterium]|nr:Hsp20/alpha crystallin family protein [Bernardetiaceae bacterium]MDW8211384.1 Hsp20/alpha crystallin family protein [Cytophagales bacterium]
MATVFPRRHNPFYRFGERYGHFIGEGEFLGRSALGENISIAPHSATNISKNEEFYEIEVIAPGFDKDDIEISLHQGILTVKADKKVKRKSSGKTYLLQEYNHEMLERSYELPDNVDTEKISARYENGILYLTLPCKKIESPKQVTIQ